MWQVVGGGPAVAGGECIWMNNKNGNCIAIYSQTVVIYTPRELLSFH